MAQPASGAPTSELVGSGSVTKLLLRFTVAGIVVMVLLAISSAVVARMEAVQKAIDEARNTAWVVAYAIKPSLGPGIVAGDVLAVTALDSAVHRFMAGDSLVRVKICDQDGKIFYSDAAALIGKRFDLGANQRRALEEGTDVAGVSNLNDPENALEAHFGQLLEVDIGLRTTTGQPVLFE